MPARTKRRASQSHKMLHLLTYQRLEENLSAFARGHFHRLILVWLGGPPRALRAGGGRPERTRRRPPPATPPGLLLFPRTQSRYPTMIRDRRTACALQKALKNQ